MAQEQKEDKSKRSTLNINIGILGHVDSGKTSIARALSTHFSTCSIDKSPQEKERGITIELGFSCFTIPIDQMPAKHRKSIPSHISNVQFTLVDCPGHASLIRTIIGGAQIIDFMLLVIDINKGIQTQTAECLVLGEILTHETQLIVVLNKMDLFLKSIKLKKGQSHSDVVTAKLEKKKNAIRKVFKKTKFGKSVQIIAITANRDGSNVPGQSTEFDTDINQIAEKSEHIQSLIDGILSTISIPDRSHQSSLPFLAAVDHCFGIKGQGTILTSTILQGTLKLHQTVEIPNFKEQRKVRSIQCYGNAVDSAIAGDRVSIAIAQFNSDKMNRGLLCAPNTVPTIHRAIARCDRIRFFKENIESNAKFHITIGHATTVAQIQCFRVVTPTEIEQHRSDEKNMEKYADALNKDKGSKSSKSKKSKDDEKELDGTDRNIEVKGALDWDKPFDFGAEYLALDQLDDVHQDDGSKSSHILHETYVLLTFSKPVCAATDSLLIGSRFDNQELRKDVCRLGFTGKIVAVLKPPRMIPLTQWEQESKMDGDSKGKVVSVGVSSGAGKGSKKQNRNKVDANLQCVRIYKPKQREGFIEKFVDGYTGIGAGMFGKGTDISLFVGLKVEMDTRFHEVGTISGSFGDSGNFYIKFAKKVKRKRSEKWKPKIYLKFRKFLYQKSRGMTQ